MHLIKLKNIIFMMLLSCSIYLTSPANAQQSLTLGQRAIDTAATLEKISQETPQQLQQFDETQVPEKIRNHKYSRITIFSGFDSSGNLSFTDTIEGYLIFAKQNGDPQDIELGEFFENLSNRYNPFSPVSGDQVNEAIEYLETEYGNENWLVAHSAMSIASVLLSYQREIPKALKIAGDSFSVIPDADDFDSQIARFYSYSVTTYLHSVLKNPDLYLSSVDGLINSSAKIRHPIESVNYLNNLIYAMRSIDDPKVTSQLVDILLRVGKKNPSDTPGLVEMRAANALVRIGDFERALPITQQGLAASENEMISRYLKIAEIQSLAAVGEAEKAQSELAAFKQSLTENEADANFAESEIFKAKGLIAMANDDAHETFANMDRYAELSTQRLLQSNNTDTSNLLANLENDKARQAEREAAREEKYRLKQDALQARIAAGQRGFAILFMLALAAIFTAAFMAYRSRTATKLAIAAEASLAGEKAKTQFLAVISHELRTPLNGIIGIADLLSRTAPTEDLRKKINIINNSGLDLLKLVEQILDMSRIDADELEIFPETADIREVIGGIDMLWRPTIETNNVTFTSHVDSSVPDFLLIDPLRLRQCVNNLVSNASKFTSEGRIHMHVIAEDSEADNSALLKIIVADTGMGIRKEVQDNLFRPFVQADSSITRQYGGSGLGLAITRSLARMMGGDVTVTSREGAGSEFTVSFTAKRIGDTQLLDTMDTLFSQIEEDDNVQAEAAEQLQIQEAALLPTPTAAHAMASDGPKFTDIMMAQDSSESVSMPDISAPNFDDMNGVRVLVVEDIVSNQDVMKIFLEPEGCEVMCADNGIFALAALKTQDFDVVLMDIRMPEMDGIEATRLIRSEGGRNTYVPIIALTADATAETNAQCMAAGANIFLTKPIIATELFDSIRFVRRQSYNRLETDQETRRAASAISRISA